MKKIKATVRKEFIDKYTGLKHKPGEVLEVDPARLREIKRSGDYVEVKKDESAEVKKEKQNRKDC